MKAVRLTLCFLVFAAPSLLALEPPALEALPLPNSSELNAAADLPMPEPNRDPEGWANPGILGQTGIIALRGLDRLEFKVLKTETGSPAHGKILPGDLVIGTDGRRFEPEDYTGHHKSVARCNRFSEPYYALGRALGTAASERQGKLVLTVRRGEKEGTVTVQLPSKHGFSSTYPWNCPKSEQVAEELAARFAREELPYGKNLYATVWYGLFLLNHDPITYREKLDEIAQLVIKKLPATRSGSHLRGFGGGANVWHTALYGTFLAEHAMLTGQQEMMRPHLNLLVDLFFDARMVGNLWGHTQWHNYGTTRGGFVGASCQVGLALLCMKEAGADIDNSSLAMVMDALCSAVNRKSGHVGYGSPDNASSRDALDWEAIRKTKSQVAVESLMRQGAIGLTMLLYGRTDEALAASIYTERMILTHPTHGIAIDWGFHDAARALASTNPKACRELLDTIRYRLNLSLRWDGGLQLIPYFLSLGRGTEYDVERYGADKYVPAMWGLILTMQKKRLWALSKVAGPGDVVKLPPPRVQALPESIGARQLTCGGGKAYYTAVEGTSEWGVFERDFASNTTKILKGGFSKSAQELFYQNDKLYFSAPGASAWVWDGTNAKQLLSVNSRQKAPAMFTPFKDAIYFISPSPGKGVQTRQLWKTDATEAGTVMIKDELPLLLGGSTAWQSDVAHAQSMIAALGKLFFVTCDIDPDKRPDYDSFSLWVTDGTAAGIEKLMTKKLDVRTIDNGNSPRGSYLGIEYDGKLYFSAENRLWESDGSKQGTRESPLKLIGPNNFSAFKGKLLLSSTRGRGPKAKVELVLTDGTQAQTERALIGVNHIRQITVVDDRLIFFIANDGEHGDELWVSDGTKENTRLLRDVRQGHSGGVLDNLISVKGRLYFSASDGERGNEVWISDGTEAGTRCVDLLKGPAGSIPSQFRTADGQLFFYTTASTRGQQLWRHTPK